MTTNLAAAALVFLALFLVGAAVRAGGAWARRRHVAAIGRPDRTAAGVRVRATVDGSAVLPGMKPGRGNVTIADLALGGGRFVLSSERGVLVDVGASHGRPLGSARCTGPGRLVLEGDAPRLTGPPGSWRMEITIDDAEGWARALQPYVAGGSSAAPAFS